MEVKKAWEEKKSYIIERKRRDVASYKEFEGFRCSLEHASQVVNEFGFQITIRHFKVRYHKLEVDEDPFAELPSNVEVLAPVRYHKLDVDKDPFKELPSNAEVLAPVEVALDNCPATPPALPPPS
ncbi:hypothetical protein GW17_00025315 [Ensete ventricosum]|nr:hypothetical protein GW17_00025315 [Ensete ventricosum]